MRKLLLMIAGYEAALARRSPATPAATKVSPRYNKPLPKKIVENNWSSSSARRSRTTPMNHRKAIPANGNKLKAREIVLACPASTAPVSDGSVGMESRMSVCPVAKSTAKIMPAMAAARGVLRRRLDRLIAVSDIVFTSDSVYELANHIIRIHHFLANFRMGILALSQSIKIVYHRQNLFYL